MVRLEASWIVDHHIVESHKQVKLESSSVSEEPEENNHRIGRLEDGLYPTTPDVNQQYPYTSRTDLLLTLHFKGRPLTL